MQYLMTPNTRDEINGFVWQVDNLRRNFNVRSQPSPFTNRIVHGFIEIKNILRICANNEVSDSYLRALEHGMIVSRGAFRYESYLDALIGLA